MKGIFMIILWLAASWFVSAQKLSQDYLNNLDEEELLTKFPEYDGDSIVQEQIARTYLERAKMVKDTIKMARGYDRLSRVFHPAKNIAFTDSIIWLTKDMNHITYPAMGYILKAYENSVLGDINNEYKYFLKAYEKIEQTKNYSQMVYVMDRLIHLQSDWGNKEKALDLQNRRHAIVSSQGYFEEVKKSTRKAIQGNTEYLVRSDLMSSYQSYIYCYLKLKRYDSANYYLEKLNYELTNYTEIDSSWQTIWVTEATMEIQYYLGNYNKSIEASDSLQNQINKNKLGLGQEKNLRLFKGLSLLKLDNHKEGLQQLLLADSIFDSNGRNIYPHYNRLLFEKLYDYYTTTGESEKQIEYLDKIIVVDSLMKVNYQYFEPEHIRLFETPKLLEAKETLITGLQNKNEKSNRIIRWAVAALIVSLFLIFYYFNRQVVYKKRFETLQKNTQQKREEGASKNVNRHDVPTEIISDILDKLQKFEAAHGYLAKDLNLNRLAKKFHTNANYLSRTINFKKGMNFRQYLHDLRIEYSVMELLVHPEYRKYTIRAIAKECGYRSAESFSKAFYKKHGIYPSYYIAKINKSAI
jgi:AraC-like DNA-binding protein